MVELLNIHKDVYLTQEMVTPTKVVPSVNIVREKSPKKVIPSVNIVQEESTKKIIPPIGNVQEKSPKKIIPPIGNVLLESPKKVLTSVKVVQEESPEKTDDSSDDSSDDEEYEKDAYGFYVSKKPAGVPVMNPSLSEGIRSSPSIDDEVFDIENHDYKNWDPEYIKTLPNHVQVWINDFVIPAMSDAEYDKNNKRETVNKIRDFITKCEAARGSENKILVTKEMFRYMATTQEAIHFLINQKIFIKTLKDKIKELSYDDQKPYSDCDGKTKKFLYAISVITV